MTKVWITKYALTTGIFSAGAVVYSDGMVCVPKPRGSIGIDSYYHGDDWHPSLGNAIERAEEMRTKKILSLEKQLTRLKVKKFTVADYE